MILCSGSTRSYRKGAINVLRSSGKKRMVPVKVLLADKSREVTIDMEIGDRIPVQVGNAHTIYLTHAEALQLATDLIGPSLERAKALETEREPRVFDGSMLGLGEPMRPTTRFRDEEEIRMAEERLQAIREEWIVGNAEGPGNEKAHT